MARYQFQGIFHDGNGKVVSDGTISVYLAGTTTVASVYTASSGGTAVNSVTSDSSGVFSFWVDDSDYGITQLFKLVLSMTNFETKTYDNIFVCAQTSSLVDLTTAQTFTNKTLTTPVVASLYQDAGKTKLMTVPNTASDTLTANAATQTLTNKTLTSPILTTPLINDGDTGLSITSANQTHAAPTVTIPNIGDAADTFVMADTAQTLTNKTLTSPVINVSSDAEGDIYYRNSSGVLTRLAREVTGKVLTMSGNVPAWTDGKWTQTTGTFTATPASTSTITMTTDLTATILVGYPLKYVIGGTTYYGKVSAIAANLLTIHGAALGGDVTALSYGNPTSITEVVIIIPSSYEDATSTGLIAADLNSVLLWKKAKSYLVEYTVYSKTHDSTTHGTATVYVNAQDVNTTAGGLTIAADATEYSTVVDINTTYYDINHGEAIEIGATKAGAGDATHLTVHMTFVTP